MSKSELILPPRKHRCAQPRDMGMGSIKNPWRGKDNRGPETLPFPIPVEHGTLWRCPDCARWWVARPNPLHGRGLYFAGGGLEWRPVGWWNFTLRRRIR